MCVCVCVESMWLHNTCWHNEALKDELCHFSTARVTETQIALLFSMKAPAGYVCTACVCPHNDSKIRCSC